MPKFLASLGIKFHSRNRQTFWLANEGELEFIYADFQRRAREVKAELHPDAGGETELFVAFSQAVENVQKAFRKRGIEREFTKAKPRKTCLPLKRHELSPLEQEQLRKRDRARLAIYRAKHRQKINAMQRRNHAARKKAVSAGK